MRAFTNTIAALSLIGTAAVSAPAPASAQVYFGVPGISVGIGAPYYGPGYNPYYYPGYYRPYWGHHRGYRSWGGRRHGFYGPAPAYGFTGRSHWRPRVYGFYGHPHWRPRAYGFYGHPHWRPRAYGFYHHPYAGHWRHIGFRHYGAGHGFYGRAIMGGHRFRC